jgi:4-amino-4-deoxy-L-arabinose transferase-like glycosyltransferase
MGTASKPVAPRSRRLALLVVLALGLMLFVWRLGSTGLVDETPPLFAASARAMAESGDWLIPHVNGLPRYDKPPLVYWLMGALYALPGQAHWNPLGTWASSLPSALASVALMLLLCDTLLRRPQPGSRPPAVVAVTAALAFALSPLVLLWGRIGVSDAVFSALVAASLLMAWRTYAAGVGPWWPAWPVLGLAVLTKGPVAVILFFLTLLSFGWLQADLAGLRRRLRPLAGLALTALVSLPWYGLALLREGRPYWDSFFGYHNLQRFTAVVNDHLQPWWFFAPVLVVASLPATPLLLLGLTRAIGPLVLSWRRPAQPRPAAASLDRFAACWLLAVLAFFTLAATKLPSYWLPATPAAGVLIALACRTRSGSGDDTAPTDPAGRLAWHLTLLLAALLAGVFALAPLWVPLINDPEMPTLPGELLASALLVPAALCLAAAALAGWILRRRPVPIALLALQLPFALFVPAALLPCWSLGDQVRGLPVRRMAEAVGTLAKPGEPLAMVGILKPSLHYYSRRLVIYEGRWAGGLMNLAERLRREQREGQRPSAAALQPTVLLVIDATTATEPYWQGLAPQELAREGLYRLWRVDRQRLEAREASLRAAGVRPDWHLPVPERY